jgi:hypothetical protein
MVNFSRFASFELRFLPSDYYHGVVSSSSEQKTVIFSDDLCRLQCCAVSTVEQYVWNAAKKMKGLRRF